VLNWIKISNISMLGIDSSFIVMHHDFVCLALLTLPSGLILVILVRSLKVVGVFRWCAPKFGLLLGVIVSHARTSCTSCTMRQFCFGNEEQMEPCALRGRRHSGELRMWPLCLLQSGCRSSPRNRRHHIVVGCVVVFSPEILRSQSLSLNFAIIASITSISAAETWSGPTNSLGRHFTTSSIPG